MFIKVSAATIIMHISITVTAVAKSIIIFILFYILLDIEKITRFLCSSLNELKFPITFMA